MPTNREKDKEDVAHIYMKYYSDIEKEWNTVIFSNMDGPRDRHTEWSQSEKNIIWYHFNTQNLKEWYKRTYLQNRNRVTYIENKFMITVRRGKERDKLGLTYTHYYIT